MQVRLYLLMIFQMQFRSAVSCDTLADDAVIFFAHRDAVVIEKVLNEELSIVNNWTNKSFLFFNIIISVRPKL